MDDVPAADFESTLIDVSDLPLDVVLNADDTVLANALRRIEAEAERGDDDTVAGFSSSI